MLLLILVAYIGLVFFLATRKVKVSRLDQFLISRGTLNPYVLGVSFAASYASVSIFMGVAGWAYNWGEPVLFYQASVTICTLLGLGLFGFAFRFLAESYKPLSLADWIGKHYNSRFLRASVGFLTLWNVFYIAGQFIATALILDTFFGVPFVPSVGIAVVVSTLFVVVGGMQVNVRSDFLQGMIMLLVAVIVVVRGGGEFGWSPSRLHAALSAIDVNLVGLINPDAVPFSSVPALISIAWLLLIFPANPHLMNVILALKSPGDFGKFIITSGVCLFFFSLAPLAGLYARGMGLQLDRADAAFPEFLLAVFPRTVAFLLILAVLSAGLTTVSSLLVSLSGALSHDLRTLILGKHDSRMSEASKLRLGRIGIVIVAAASGGIALTRPASLTLLIWIGINGILSGVSGPLLGGIFLSRVGKVPAVISFIVGFFSYLICYPWLIKNVLAAGALACAIGVCTIVTANAVCSVFCDYPNVDESAELP